MSTIRETVRTTLDEEGFASYADHTAAWATIKALEEREGYIVTRLLNRLADLNISEPGAEQFLVDVGLAEPTPEPEPEPVMSVEERLDYLVGVTTTLTDMITRLVNAASRNGITV